MGYCTKISLHNAVCLYIMPVRPGKDFHTLKCESDF